MRRVKTVRVVTKRDRRVILESADIADSFFPRLRGLLGRRLKSGEGLIIKPCKAIHTIGMNYHIDACFVDRENRICRLLHSLPPNRLSPTVRQAAYVIEAPAGTFLQAGVEQGDEIECQGSGMLTPYVDNNKKAGNGKTDSRLFVCTRHGRTFTSGARTSVLSGSAGVACPPGMCRHHVTPHVM